MNRFIKYNIYLLIFILPWQTRYFLFPNAINNEFWEYGSYTIYISELLLLLIVILKLIQLLMGRGFKIRSSEFLSQPTGTRRWTIGKSLEFIKKHPVLFWALLLLFYIFLSNIWSGDNKISLFYIIRFSELGLLVWLILISQLDRKKILFFFVLGVSLQAALGISQFFTQEIEANKWLGIAAQEPQDLGTSVVETKIRRYLRAYGGLPHPNILGGWLLVGLWVVVFLLLPKDTLQKYKTYFLLFIYSLLLIALILTFSRSAWLGFMLGWGLLLIWYISIFSRQVFFKKKDSSSSFKRAICSSRLFILLFINAAILILVGCLLKEPLTQRIPSWVFKPQLIGRLEYQSIQQRQAGLAESYLLIKKHPWFGSGVGTYTYRLYYLYPIEAAWNLQPVHNVFLLIWSELGIVGLLLVVVLYGLLIEQCYKERKFFRLVLLGSLLPVLLFDHYLWTLYSGLMLTGVVGGLSAWTSWENT